jgi:hypothetical protein
MGNEVFILTGKPLFSLPKNKIDLEVFYLTTPYLRGISYKLGNKIPKIPSKPVKRFSERAKYRK